MTTKPLTGRNLDLADYAFARFGIKIPSGYTVDEITDPLFFRGYAPHLKPGAMIIVLSDDFEIDMDLRVTAVSRTSVTTRIIRDSSAQKKPAKKPKAEASVELPPEYEVSWGGPKHLWRFLHAGEVIGHGYAEKSLAEAAVLADYQKNHLGAA